MSNYVLKANNIFVLVIDERNPWSRCFWSMDIETYKALIFHSKEQAKTYWGYLKNCKDFYNMNRNLGETFTISICEVKFEKEEEWEEEL